VRHVLYCSVFEKAVSIPLYSGAAYYSSMFIDSAGTIGIYGSTDGKINQGNSSFGALDWFYLETSGY